MNKLIRQTERQEVDTPLVKNMSVANDSLLFLLHYLRSFIYISFYTSFVRAHFILHHFISFYNFIILFLVIVLCLSYSYVYVSFASLCMCKRSDRCVLLSNICHFCLSYVILSTNIDSLFSLSSILLK